MTALLAPPVVRPPRPTAAKPSSAPTPTPRLWTRLEFQNLGDQGLFEGRRASLIRGVIYEEGPMNGPHVVSLRKVGRWLDRLFPVGHDVRTQVPLDLGADTEPHPDVALVTGSIDDYLVDHPTPAQTLLVVEVADTSLQYDLTTKAELYAEAGIAEYWVLDVENRTLAVLRAPAALPPGGHAYQSTTTYQPTDSVAPLAAPHAPVLVSELLP